MPAIETPNGIAELSDEAWATYRRMVHAYASAGQCPLRVLQEADHDSIHELAGWGLVAFVLWTPEGNNPAARVN